MKTVITDHPFPTLDLAQAIFSRNGIDLEAMQTKRHGNDHCPHENSRCHDCWNGAH